jgi:hypothetical protein
MNKRSIGWLITFVALVAGSSFGVYYLTGQDAIGAATRFLWNTLVFIVNGLIRAFGGLAVVLAKGVGLRRVSRLATLLAGVGLGYAGSVILSDAKLKRAHGWRGKLKAAVTMTRNRWQRLHLIWKLLIVAALIASQVYLHALLIVFPVAFLVPVVRRLWVQTADLLLGNWYWRTFGRVHRSAVAALQTLPGWRQLFGAMRLWRIRYLCAWRLWKYDPRYRLPDTSARLISFAEPLRLWWRGDLDRYIGRPLLAGATTKAHSHPSAERTFASGAGPFTTARGAGP